MNGLSLPLRKNIEAIEPRLCGSSLEYWPKGGGRDKDDDMRL